MRFKDSHHEDLPAAVHREEVAENVEVATLERLELLPSSLFVVEVDTLQKELSTQLLVRRAILTHRRQVLLKKKQRVRCNVSGVVVSWTDIRVVCGEAAHHVPHAPSLAFHRLALSSLTLHHSNATTLRELEEVPYHGVGCLRVNTPLLLHDDHIHRLHDTSLQYLNV